MDFGGGYRISVAGFNGSILASGSGPVPGCIPGGPMVDLGAFAVVRWDHDGAIDKMPVCALSPAVDFAGSATARWLAKRRVH